MTPSRRIARAAAGVTLYGLAACACGPRSPEAALRQLERAVQRGDAIALFDALDQPTRWAWMTVVRCHREAYDVVAYSFPPGQERARALRHFESGAQVNSPAELFAREAGATALLTLKRHLPPAGTIELAGATAHVAAREAGAPPLLFRAVKGRWGYAGFAEDALDRQKRALSDLELIKQDALAYERAARRRSQ